MNQTIRTFFVALSISISLAACSSTSLQGKRLDTAEANLLQAEQALAASNIPAADNSLGTASAYLATLKDYKKFLNKNEFRRFQLLQERAEGLTRTINTLKLD
jgi:hypothetical protein